MAKFERVNDQITEEKSDRNNSENSYGTLNGLAGLSKSYSGQDKFTGKWEENLEGAILLYETFSKLWHLPKKEMSDGIPIMLSEDKLSYYTMNISSEEKI